MQIALPEDIAIRLTQLAEQQQQSVEDLLAEKLLTVLSDEKNQLPISEQAELQALHHLSDDVLQLIASEQMKPEDQKLLNELMQGNREGTLSQEEKQTLAALVERGDQLMLRKAETAAILVSRGYIRSAGTFIKPNV